MGEQSFTGTGSWGKMEALAGLVRSQIEVEPPGSLGEANIAIVS